MIAEDRLNVRRSLIGGPRALSILEIDDDRVSKQQISANDEVRAVAYCSAIG